MDRDIKVFNRPIVDKIQKKNQQLHLKRLKSIQSGSNRTMPINHSISNKKAALMEEFKKTEIEKQNVLLFNRMMRIMKRPDPLNQPKTSMQRNNRTAIEYSRITQENRCMFERLEQQKPTISNKKLQQERRKNLNILKFLGKYPNPLANRTFQDSEDGHTTDLQRPKRPSGPYMGRGYNMNEEDQFDQEMYEEEMEAYQQQIKNIRKNQNLSKSRQGALSSSSDTRRRFMSQAVNRRHKMESQCSDDTIPKLDSLEVHIAPHQINNPKKNNNFHQSHEQNISERVVSGSKARPTPEILLYQCKMQIEKRPALVQFYRNYHNYQIKATFQSPLFGRLIHKLEIPESEGNQFFSIQNYNYPKIAKMLIMEDENLVILPEAAEPKDLNKIILEKDQSRKSMLQQQPNIPMPKYEQDLDEYIE